MVPEFGGNPLLIEEMRVNIDDHIVTLSMGGTPRNTLRMFPLKISPIRAEGGR